VRCNRTAAVQTGTLSCSETSNPGNQVVPKSWDLLCPGASAVSPTLVYNPPPTNTVPFPSGSLNQVVTTSIQVVSSGAVGTGSTTLSCSLGGAVPAAFQIPGGNGQVVSALNAAVNLQLACTLGSTLRTATLNCTETDLPSNATRVRNWPLTCGPGIASGVITVGARIGLRDRNVVIPIGFRGEGTTGTIDARVSFDTTRLSVVSLQGIAGALCTQPDATQIRVQFGTPGALPTVDTRYCEVTFRVANNAPGGAIPLVVSNSICTDQGGSGRPCTVQNGLVAVAALNPSLADGSTMVIAGYVGTLAQSRTLRVENFSTSSHQLNSCTLSPVSAELRITAPTGFPLTIGPQGTGLVTVACTLPALGQSRTGTLTCNTTDPMRSQMRYELSCASVAIGAALPADQILDIEQREGELIGTSAARGVSADGALTVLGAPLGGSDGNGRVLVFADVPAAGQLAAEAHSTLRLITSLQAPSGGRDKALLSLGCTTSSTRQGQAVALRGDGAQIAVGAPCGGRGRVTLFNRPAGGWSSFDSRTSPSIPVPAPSLPGSGETAEFGGALAYTPQGDLVVGAPGSSTGVSGSGAVFVYANNGTSLDPPLSVTSSNAVGNGRFGASLAVRNDQIVVGATGEFSDVIKTGAAYRIQLLGGTPGAATRITPPTALSANDEFGSAVALSGNVLVIGASGTDTVEGINSGSAWVFRQASAAAPWVQAGQLLPAIGSGANQDMGAAIAINGNMILVGAPKADVSTLADRGRAYAYQLTASITQRPSSILENEGGKVGDEFGRALVLAGTAVVVGVPKADLLLSNSVIPLNDVGRADTFSLESIFANGFE